MSEIIVPQWNKRSLNKGFVWQEYFTSAIRKISEDGFAKYFGSSKERMDREREKWEDALYAYIMNRSHRLGMNVRKVAAACIEEPNQDKPLEVVMWTTAKLKFVWSLWAYIEGPVREEFHQPDRQLPLEGFWPHSVVRLTDSVAEVIHAEAMLEAERNA